MGILPKVLLYNFKIILPNFYIFLHWRHTNQNPPPLRQTRSGWTYPPRGGSDLEASPPSLVEGPSVWAARQVGYRIFDHDPAILYLNLKKGNY